jgi:hypothetical protein
VQGVTASLSYNFILKFPNHRTKHENMEDNFRMLFTKKAIVILMTQNMSPDEENSSAEAFI